MFSCTWNDYFKGVKPWNLLKDRHPDLVMMDRADHYFEDAQMVNYLRELSKE